MNNTLSHQIDIETLTDVFEHIIAAGEGTGGTRKQLIYHAIITDGRLLHSFRIKQDDVVLYRTEDIGRAVYAYNEY